MSYWGGPIFGKTACFHKHVKRSGSIVCIKNLDENKAHTDRELLKYQYGEGGPRSNGFNFKNG